MGIPVKLDTRCRKIFNAMVESDKKAVPATFIVVKGKTKSEMLLGWDTAMELGVLTLNTVLTKTTRN